MTQFEYKIVKSRVVELEYYSNWLSLFGWQVQNVQELVDQVVDNSVGFSYNMGSSNIRGRAFHNPYSHSTRFSGHQSSDSWGVQNNANISTVITKLSITLSRDLNLPNRAELIAFENRWWTASEKYLSRLISHDSSDEKRWPEWQEMHRINQEILDFKSAQRQKLTDSSSKISKYSENNQKNNTAQVPNLPATATIKKIDVKHNIVQSGQVGLQVEVEFSIQNRKGLPCEVCAFFFDENNESLLDNNKTFYSTTGTVVTYSQITPEYEDALYKNITLFLPYAELDLPDCKHKLSFHVSIYDVTGKSFITRSEKVYFEFVKTGTDMRGDACERVVPIPSQPAAAAITKLNIAYDVIHSGELGIQMHLDFNIQHRKGLKCQLNSYFFDEKNEFIKAHSSKYATPQGHVDAFSNFSPESDDASYKDFILFLPYSELEARDGHQIINTIVQIFDFSLMCFIANSQRIFFVFTKNGTEMHAESCPPPTASVRQVEKVKPVKVEKSKTTKLADDQNPATPEKKSIVPKTQEEREQFFLKSNGWTEITEDRRLCMDGWFQSIDNYKSAEAIKKLKKAIALNPDEPVYWLCTINALYSKEKKEESFEMAEKALNKFPGNISILNFLGYYYIHESNFQKTEEIIIELEKSPDPDAIYRILILKATSAEHQGDYKKAIQYFDQADAKATGANPLKGYDQKRCREAMKKK